MKALSRLGDLGRVSSGGTHPWRSPSTANEIVKTELRNQAAAKGADLIVLTMQDWGRLSNNASAAGIAYRRHAGIRSGSSQEANAPGKEKSQAGCEVETGRRLEWSRNSTRTWSLPVARLCVSIR